VLIEHDQIIEHCHRYPLGKNVCSFEHRHARRVIPDIHLENATVLLGERGAEPGEYREQRTGYDDHPQLPPHSCIPFNGRSKICPALLRLPAAE